MSFAPLVLELFGSHLYVSLRSSAQIVICSLSHSDSNQHRCRLMPQEFRSCNNTLSALYNTMRPSSSHEIFSSLSDVLRASTWDRQALM